MHLRKIAPNRYVVGCILVGDHGSRQSLLNATHNLPGP
jgi:hypothetical protein